MDANKILNGKFTFKKSPNGSIDKTKVICVFCRRELSYHRSTSSLKYHLMAKHTADANSPPPLGKARRQWTTWDRSPCSFFLERNESLGR
ncbi:hypothetical protein F2P81_007211 [Scophthalmus maximus]|uniref:BED-type domain-containing protein n=1 Tax=Scophthalmus maximus TaxID=52904 RepID=A0A6A4T5Q1_SCOMX|nr:hypothetical protein F2P81_007211 [Scophthalmus maximus]